MIKKRQNIARWLTLAGLLSLQMGCAGIQAGKDSQKTAKSPTADQQKQSKTVKKHTLREKKPDASASSKKSAKSQSKLTSEIFYYLFSAEIAGKRGEFGLSAALYTKAAKITRDPAIAKRATRAAYYARDNKRAIASAKLWNELEPENIEARQVLAALLVRTGKADVAVKHFEYVLTHGKQSERQRFLLITSLLSKEKDKQAALAVMSKLIAKRRNNPNALFAYSQLAFLVGNLDSAAKTIKEVIKLRSEWTEAYILQSNIFVRQGYKARAIKVLRQAVEDQSDNIRLRMFYARNLVDAKQFAEAVTQFSLVSDDEKLQHEARYALGLLNLQMNKPQQAAEYFTRLLEDKKRAVESQYYLAQSYESQNKLDKAISEYRKIRNNQYAFESELRVALILAKQGELKDAR